MAHKEYRPRLDETEYVRHLEWNSNSEDNVIVIGDLHSPWDLDGYLQHCVDTQRRFNCGRVVFIGDLIDNHYSSYHETDPDGYGAGEELDRAIARLRSYYEAFPNATVTLGNHDLLIMRKAYSSGLSKRWIKGMAEVLNTPGWDFVEKVTIHNVDYSHGTGCGGENGAFTRALHRRRSQVMGHIHTSGGAKFSASDFDLIFGLQVGCGVDEKAYAFQYAKTFSKKMVISCGVVLNKGTVPMVIPMSL
jgi:hypothetical protein